MKARYYVHISNSNNREELPFEGLKLRHLKLYEDYNTLNVPLFSIHDKKPGDKVKIGDKEVEIIRFAGWIKNHKATCLAFDAKLGDKQVRVKYDDGCDGYIIQ